jgi:Flp pilus assembly protein TadD
MFEVAEESAPQELTSETEAEMFAAFRQGADKAIASNVPVHYVKRHHLPVSEPVQSA